MCPRPTAQPPLRGGPVRRVARYRQMRGCPELMQFPTVVDEESRTRVRVGGWASFWSSRQRLSSVSGAVALTAAPAPQGLRPSRHPSSRPFADLGFPLASPTLARRCEATAALRSREYPPTGSQFPAGDASERSTATPTRQGDVRSIPHEGHR